MGDNNIIVTVSARDMRAMARQALKGKWKKTVMAALMCSAIVLLPLYIAAMAEHLYGMEWPVLTKLYTAFVPPALRLGFCMICLKTVRQIPTSPRTVLQGFESLRAAFLLNFMEGLLICLWTLLVAIPCILVMFINSDLYLPTVFVAAVTISYRYQMVFFIFADNPSKGIMQCFDESKFYMRKNKGKLFCLHFSFIGWILLLLLARFFVLKAISFVIRIALSASPTFAFVLAYSIYAVVMVIGLSIIMCYVSVAVTVFFEIAAGRLIPQEDAPCGYGYGQPWESQGLGSGGWYYNPGPDPSHWQPCGPPPQAPGSEPGQSHYPSQANPFEPYGPPSPVAKTPEEEPISYGFVDDEPEESAESGGENDEGNSG